MLAAHDIIEFAYIESEGDPKTVQYAGNSIYTMWVVRSTLHCMIDGCFEYWYASLQCAAVLQLWGLERAVLMEHMGTVQAVMQTNTWTIINSF